MQIEGYLTASSGNKRKGKCLIVNRKELIKIDKGGEDSTRKGAASSRGHQNG
jgi:hypothetical protein